MLLIYLFIYLLQFMAKANSKKNKVQEHSREFLESCDHQNPCKFFSFPTLCSQNDVDSVHKGAQKGQQIMMFLE